MPVRLSLFSLLWIYDMINLLFSPHSYISSISHSHVIPSSLLLPNNPPAALEKLLRLLQSISQVLAAWSLATEDIKLYLLLRQQFALGLSFSPYPILYH